MTAGPATLVGRGSDATLAVSGTIRRTALWVGRRCCGIEQAMLVGWRNAAHLVASGGVAVA
jgi:hypothetical protein